VVKVTPRLLLLGSDYMQHMVQVTHSNTWFRLSKEHMVQVIYRCTWFRLSKEHMVQVIYRCTWFRLFIGAHGSGYLRSTSSGYL
jgi:hypothetical protein